MYIKRLSSDVTFKIWKPLQILKDYVLLSLFIFIKNDY